MGRLMKKHHRQLTLSVKKPPRSGPATLEMPQTLPAPVRTSPLSSFLPLNPLLLFLPPQKREELTNSPRINRPLLQRHTISQHRKRPGKDPRAPNPRHRPSHDQRSTPLSHPAHEAAELKGRDGGEEDPLDTEEGVQLAEEELQGGGGEEVGGAIPAHVGEGGELGGYCWDGGCDYVVV